MQELTPPQIERLAELSDAHVIVGEKRGSPLLKGPDGRLFSVEPDGRAVALGGVLSPRSYLSLEHC